MGHTQAVPVGVNLFPYLARNKYIVVKINEQIVKSYPSNIREKKLASEFSVQMV